MFWRVLKPSRGLADEPSVHTKLPASTPLILLAATTIAFSVFPAQARPASSATNGIETETKELAAAEFPADASSGAQSWAIASAIRPGYTIRHTVPEVRLQFSVADENGRLVTDLSDRDIRIFDDHSAVHRIRHFSRADDLPLQVGLLLDVSDSVQKSLAREKLATQFFVGHVLRPQNDRAFLLAFSRDARLWQPSTSDPVALRQALDRVHQLGYATNLYDAVFYSCLNQFPLSDDDAVVQRILVLFSDGEDTGSLHALADAIAQAQRHEVQIYALSVHSGRKYSPGDEILRRLAEETGGQLYVASGQKEFASIFASMEQQMRAQYSVSFPPERETPGFHDLHIEITGNHKLRIHARQGYYFDAP